MLRRRKKSPRPDRRPVEAPQGRRRARPDVSIPAELLIPPASGVVLVTGFDPFGGEGTNPSWDLGDLLPEAIAGLRVARLRVPCEFHRAVEIVADAIDKHSPSLVVCVGQAGGRSRIGVERVAINVDDAPIADNAGRRPLDRPIDPAGPPAYFASLPIKAMVAAMRAAGAPAEVSNSAGTYVCNHLMYGVLHHIARRGLATRAGFVHVPYSEAQVVDRAGVPGMSLETMARGIEAGIAAAARTTRDIATREGATR